MRFAIASSSLALLLACSSTTEPTYDPGTLTLTPLTGSSVEAVFEHRGQTYRLESRFDEVTPSVTLTRGDGAVLMNWQVDVSGVDPRGPEYSVIAEPEYGPAADREVFTAIAVAIQNWEHTEPAETQHRAIEFGLNAMMLASGEHGDAQGFLENPATCSYYYGGGCQWGSYCYCDVHDYCCGQWGYWDCYSWCYFSPWWGC